ncbi:MAG: polysaccharide deacetylase family protein [Candidatus Sumerlaeia bacterium]|nr:polysaccharide deacetylase family protein [Candidatus Sumerlaeia bacterium]
MNPRPKGFLQVDVDGLWAVRACYGRHEGTSFQTDPCWEEGIPRLLEIFNDSSVPASFFIVGRDLELKTKRHIARQLLQDGHELANHSYTHLIGLTARPLGVIHREIRKTDRALRKIGATPVGFRSPGYDIDGRVLRAVRQIGYLYDASILPTPWVPLLRVADAWLARKLPEGKRQFGRWVYARAPRQPYFPLRYRIRKPAKDPLEQRLVEIPVGVTPGLRLPLTASALLGCSRQQLRQLFERLARKDRLVLLLLHAIDGTDCSKPIVFDNRRPRLAGFHLDGEEKEKRLRRIVEEFARAFEIVRADDHARAMMDGVAAP